MNDSFNGIEEYKNAFDKAYCKQLIDLFEERSKMQLTEHQRSGKNQDERIMMDLSNHNKMYHVDWNMCEIFYQTINGIFEEKYKEKYNILATGCRQHSPKGMSVQKSLPHQGYHAWHGEISSLQTASRIVAYTLYLNDVEKDGETEFLYQGVKIKPEAGKLIFFPGIYTHPHRGNPIYEGVKYLVTGWYTWDE